MKMILEQTVKSLRRGMLLTLIIILTFSVGLFLIVGTINYYGSSNEKLTNIYSAYSEDSYRFSFYAASARTVSQEKDTSLSKKASLLVDLLHESDKFEFYTISHYEPAVLEFKGPDTMLYGYDTSDPKKNTLQSDTGAYYSQVKAMMMDPGIFDRFALNVAEGADYSDLQTPVIHQEGTVYPVVLGWNYKEFYKINDHIQCQYPVTLKNMPPNVEFKVVGFLEPGAAIIPVDGSLDSISGFQNLDDYMIIPPISFNNLIDRDYDVSLPSVINSYYCFRYACGVIVTDNPKLDISSYSEKVGLGALSLRETMNLNPRFKSDAKKYFNLLLMASLLIIISSTVCLTINLVNKLLSNFKAYSVHIISGGTYGSLRGFMAAEAGLILLISNLIALALALFIGNEIFTYTTSQVFGISVAPISWLSLLVILAIDAVVLICSLTIPFVKLQLVQFDNILRGTE